MQTLYSIKSSFSALFPLTTKGRHRLFVCFVVLIWKLPVSLKTVANISDQMLCS